MSNRLNAPWIGKSWQGCIAAAVVATTLMGATAVQAHDGGHHWKRWHGYYSYYAPSYYAPRYYAPSYYTPSYYTPRYYAPRYYAPPVVYAPPRAVYYPEPMAYAPAYPAYAPPGGVNFNFTVPVP
jgi:hypothetical protein